MADPSDPRLQAGWRALAMVIDPEVGLDIVTMGLVYDDVSGDRHAAWHPGMISREARST